MKSDVKKLKFLTYKDDSPKKLLEKYNNELQKYRIQDHIEIINSFYQQDRILDIRNYLNSHFPNVSLNL